jgi:hypothetical protein
MKLLVSALLAVLTAGTAAYAQENIGGRYRVEGANSNGARYGGTVEITVTSRNTCRIVWRTGSTTSRGICMRNQNAFTASYTLQGQIGLVIYEIKNDGSMVGLWTVADQEGVGTETLIPLR